VRIQKFLLTARPDPESNHIESSHGGLSRCTCSS
jgi:hypothetical protein